MSQKSSTSVPVHEKKQKTKTKTKSNEKILSFLTSYLISSTSK